jgi:hypothetical protein
MTFLLQRKHRNRSGPSTAGAARPQPLLRGSPEILTVKTAEAFQQAAAFVSERLGGQGRRFLGPVGFAEQGETDAGAEEMVGGCQQTLGGRDGTEDQVGVFGIGRQELTGGFEDGMSRLNGNLGRGQVAANEHVNVGNLAEGGFHGAEPPYL